MKSKSKGENFVEKIPVKSSEIQWSADDDGLVTLHVENKGIANRIAQKLIKKPKISHIHLDEMGSFIWLLIDGEKSVFDIGKPVEEHFGEKALPLYERLSMFIRSLETNGFVSCKNADSSSEN
ncbi:MAG: PqqD family protein [Ruminococcus sp.]|nr:PqqD family protein [Ruminococcus sp.]